MEGEATNCKEILLEMEDQASVDRLSDLPLGIIHEILGRVPIENAIQTCVLSKQWRSTWTTLPSLRFHCIAFELDGRKDTCINFINNALLRHQGPFHSVKISFLHKSSIETVKEWVLCMSRNGIKDLDLGISPDWDDGADSLGSTLYACTKLTNLVLWNLKMDPPLPSFKGFLFLTDIYLARVELSADGVQSLVGNCPHLESFRSLCFSNSEFRIRSPNLKHLQVVGQYTELCVYAPLLRELYVDLTRSQFGVEYQIFLCNYTDFLGGFTDLKELTGLDYFTKYLSIGIQPYHATIVFHHLKFIKLCGVDFKDKKEISVVARLIIGAPNLHKLHIQAKIKVGDKDPAPAPGQCVSLGDSFGLAPNFTIEKLTDVSLPFVCSFNSGMQLIKFLLATSPALQTMELNLLEYSPYDAVRDEEWEDEVRDELSKFRRASPNLTILFT